MRAGAAPRVAAVVLGVSPRAMSAVSLRVNLTHSICFSSYRLRAGAAVPRKMRAGAAPRVEAVVLTVSPRSMSAVSPQAVFPSGAAAAEEEE